MSQDTSSLPEPQTQDGPHGHRAAATTRRFARKAAPILLPLVVVAFGAAGAAALVATKPKPKRRKPPKNITLVRVQPVRRSAHRVVVRAMGTVTPAREITLQPQVGGRVVNISPELMPGGRFATGHTIVQIERRDYELAVAQRKADVARAEMNYRVELGRQEIAKREWALHEKSREASALDLELALRKPHLAQTQAAVAAAEAALAQAELDLSRTTIKAPFNAIVVRKQVDLGSEVTPQTPLATLAGMDEYWVQVSIPADRVGWLKIPKQNGDKRSKAYVRMSTDPKSAARAGYVARLLSDLGTEGRMARVLVVVKDPLGLEAQSDDLPPLLLGAYVQASIEGRGLSHVVAIPRVALRGADRLWLMSEKNKLVIRKVEVAWRDRDVVLVRSGLSDGELLVVSDISAPVDGLDIRSAEQLAAPRDSGGPGPGQAERSRARGKGKRTR